MGRLQRCDFIGKIHNFETVCSLYLRYNGSVFILGVDNTGLGHKVCDELFSWNNMNKQTKNLIKFTPTNFKSSWG